LVESDTSAAQKRENMVKYMKCVVGTGEAWGWTITGTKMLSNRNLSWLNLKILN